MRRFFKTICLLLLFTFTLIANDRIPGAVQKQPIAIINATIFPVSAEKIENGTLVFSEGKITAIGNKQTVIPANAHIIDAAGKHIYPAMIAANTQLGLVEVGAVRATRDYSEVGRFTPNVMAATAYNTDSEIIPTVRSNGIAIALSAPSGGILVGRSTLVNLDAWNINDAAINKVQAMHLYWPRMVNISWQDAQKQEKDRSKNLKELAAFFDKALHYNLQRKADATAELDLSLEAMRAVMEGHLPLYIHAGEYKQITAALAFKEKYGFKMVLVDGADSWKLTQQLKALNIPVILRQTQSLPSREDEDYDISFKRPALLAEAGVKFCISKVRSTSWDTRNLPFHAGQAVAFGLPYEAALKSVTLWPAEILGIEGQYGSLEVGKSATLIVSSGDILDMRSNNITEMFIDGRKTDLENKHTLLYKKYEQRLKR